MDTPTRFTTEWRLVIQHPEATSLADALEPETGDYAELSVEASDRLVMQGQGDPGQALHTLDDLLACVTAASQAVEID